MRTMRPDEQTRVVDVGVDDGRFGEGAFAPQNFFEELYPWPENVTAVALHEGKDFVHAYPSTTYVRADACDLPFEDKSFDLYFSNAVIEHVGDRRRQRRFVTEALRVAERVFMTTPNRWFPVEVHTRLPLVHWLPASTANAVYERLRKPWAKNLFLPLGSSDFRALFPGETNVRIINLGMTLVAVSGE